MIAFNRPTASGEGEPMLSFSGRTFRAREIAAKELDRHGLQIEKYDVLVEQSPTKAVVLFVDPSRAPRQLGSGPHLPGFEAEVDVGTLEVSDSNFTK